MKNEILSKETPTNDRLDSINNISNKNINELNSTNNILNPVDNMLYETDNVSNSTDNISYINISSTVLRNKFEKNRKQNLQNLIEKNTNNELSINNFIGTINLTIAEHESTMKNILSDLKHLENNMKQISTSLDETVLTNVSAETKMKKLAASIAKIENKESDFLLKSQYIDYSGALKIVNSSIKDINDKLKKISTDDRDEDKKSFSFFIEDTKECLNNLNIKINEMNTQNQFPLFENIVQEKMEVFSRMIEQETKERKESEDILKLVIDSILPKDFDCQTYAAVNDDICSFNEFELKRHYILYGKKEDRIYLLDTNTLPDNFEWKEYLQLNIDVARVFSTKCQTENHYLKYGLKDKRMYKMSQLEDVTFFVYSGRKSGSSTLNYSFLNLDDTLSIQIHNNEDFLYKYGQCKYNSVFELVENNMNNHKNIYIFDSYRTPIEKKISSFFEDIDKYIPNYKECDISFLISYFNKKYIYGKKCSHIYTEDYEPLDEMMEHFSLPPIKNFDFDKKYNIIQHKNLVFVKIRFNEIKRWDELVSKIIGTPIIMKDKNVSENKDYNNVYNNFKKNYKIPKEFLEKLKSDSRFITYNSNVERMKYIKDWTTKSE